MPKEELQVEVKKLISLGKQKGYLTYEELNNTLPAEMVSSEQLSNLMTIFGEMDIEIIDGSEGERDQRKMADNEEAAEEVEEAEELEEGEKEIDLTPGLLSRTDDPVRLYLKEMGSVALLSREGEIEIAKRIEEGKKNISSAVFGLPMTIAFCMSLRDKLKSGKISVREIVPYEEEFEEEAEERDDSELRERTLDALNRVRKISKTLMALHNKSRRTGHDPSRQQRVKAQIKDVRRQVVEKMESVNLHAVLRDRMVQRVRDLAQEFRTAEREISQCQRKLGVSGRSQAIERAVALGLVDARAGVLPQPDFIRTG